MQEEILQYDRFDLSCPHCNCVAYERARRVGPLPQAPLKCDCGHFYTLFGHDEQGWHEILYVDDPGKLLRRKNNGTHRNV